MRFSALTSVVTSIYICVTHRSATAAMIGPTQNPEDYEPTNNDGTFGIHVNDYSLSPRFVILSEFKIYMKQSIKTGDATTAERRKLLTDHFRARLASTFDDKKKQDGELPTAYNV